MNIILDSPLDMHVHFRDGRMLELVAPMTAECFSGALVMPNLVPPITTLEAALAYKNRIFEAVEDDFDPFMTLFLQDTDEFGYSLEDAKDNIAAIKLYPKGMTTNSDHGVDISSSLLLEIFKEMEKLGIPLCVHGETGGYVMDREQNFLPYYKVWAAQFPNLKIIMEHITTVDAVWLLSEFENLYATVTVQHLLYDLDDLAGGMLKPHLFCKPILKTPRDKDGLREAVFGGHSKIMFGSDSAPHPIHKKECCGCAAGCFTAPVALPLLAQEFDKNNALDKLQGFVSDNARKIYGIDPIPKKVYLKKGKIMLREIYGSPHSVSVVPICAGKELEWYVEKVERDYS